MGIVAAVMIVLNASRFGCDIVEINRTTVLLLELVRQGERGRGLFPGKKRQETLPLRVT